MISTKGKYAIRVMIGVAVGQQSNDVVSLKSIVEKDNLSQKYIEQVVSLLTKSKLLISVRGNNGGYKLSKPIEQYNIYEILTVVEGSVLPVPNIDSDNSLSNITKPFFKEYNKYVEDYLKQETLVKLIDEYNNSNYVLDYCI